MVINYTTENRNYMGWFISEDSFKEEHQGKFETIFCLGNGYMGLRAAMEETYPGEKRGCYIAGLYDCFKDEVTELPNIPDFIGFNIFIEGERFCLLKGKILSYQRNLNLKEGLLTRNVLWESPRGLRTQLIFERFVSLANKHIAGLMVSIKPLNYSGMIELSSGFNGQVTNSGTQHFVEGDKRVLPEGSYFLATKTQQSNIALVMAARQGYFIDEVRQKSESKIKMERRSLYINNKFKVNKGEILKTEKIVSIYTGLDIELCGQDTKKDILDIALENLNRSFNKGYKELCSEHKKQWSKLWDVMDIEIIGSDFDRLAVRFAQFHLIQMTPSHDSRISIAAKGLSGEGYKGHVFWDTEIFILPFYIYTFPEIARKLLLYRYHTLDGARKKARENGYLGAMFAWESARDGTETTPRYGHLDIKTGKPIRIWCGDIEQHITADIAYAIWNYCQATLDYDFMHNYGAEIILDTARFWASRVEYNMEKDQYEINDVIGPDEYSEHVNNNAYTNYMVKWHLEKAVYLYNKLRNEKEDKWRSICNKLNLHCGEVEEWKIIALKLYTPCDEESGLIPQFDGFFEQKEIDLSKYRGKIGAILEDIKWEEITRSQVLKQADVIILLYLLWENFSLEVKQINWDYYEPKTLHDSSLSPGIHAILAARMGYCDKAYNYFQESCKIDLGPDMKSSDAGLHAASLGSIWQVVIKGFAGLDFKNGYPVCDPCLPEEWKSLSFKIVFHGKRYLIEVSKTDYSVTELK